ncbi:MAG: hypothetical protein SGCHY_003825 [Lobulomycetales sp.]
MIHSSIATACIVLLASFANAKTYVLEGCEKTCFRKEVSDYTEQEMSLFNQAWSQYENTDRYRQRTEQFRDLYKQGSADLLRARVFLRDVEEDLANYHPEICVPYFDYTLQWQNVSNSAACQRTGIYPEPKPYTPCSAEVMANLQRSCLREKDTVQPYKNFQKQLLAYSAEASGVLGTEFNPLTLMKTCYEDMAYSNYQIGLAVESKSTDNSNQYDGDLDEECGSGKRVRDVLDCRDICVGYIPHGVSDAPAVPAAKSAPAHKEEEKENDITDLLLPSGNTTLLPTNQTIVTADPKTFAIRECPVEYWPENYAKPVEAPAPCSVKAYMQALTDTPAKELEKYSETDTNYDELPAEVAEVARKCQERNNLVSKEVAAGTYKDEVLMPDYTENYPYVGVAAQMRSGSAKSAASTMAFITTLFLLL